MQRQFNAVCIIPLVKNTSKLLLIAVAFEGFVVVEPDEKFFEGDILMAAGWSKPARNQARGNVFSGYDIEWTGPKYLR